MGKLDDAVKRRTHKERAQPATRRRFGLLEKKKDYLLRAKDFHRKEAALKGLRRKAEERNPDEFYFAMEHARTKDGVHVARATEANKYSQAELQLLRTQDVGYLSLKAQAEAKKVERLQSSLHLIGVPQQSKHTVFVDDKEAAARFDPAQHFDTPAELLDRAYNRPRHAQLAEPQAVAGGGEPAARLAARVERTKASAYHELLQRQERQQKLGGLAAALAMQKEVAGKGRKRKLRPDEAGGAAGVFRWKAERKR